MTEKKLKWEKTQEIGVKTNIINPALQGLKEVLKHEKSELERKLRNLKMLGVIAMDKKIDFEKINKKIEEIKD